MKVLVVEDEEKIAQFLKKGLAEKGYSVEAVGDADAALARLEGAPYDLLILDLLLPGSRDGLELCREIRARGIPSKILMLTARDTVENKIEGLDAGADDYLVKPFEIRHLARISQNILFLARGESGRVTLSFSNQDLARFVSDVTRELAPAAADHELELSVDVPDEPVIGFVDPGRMQQVLHNLLENSMRYTPAGGSVRVRLTRTAEEARIEVSDTGLGIPEADLPFVFERFFRSDRARRAYSGGSGLGLSIVRWIVEAHKGKVEVESELDLGTTFAVRLPLVH